MLHSLQELFGVDEEINLEKFLRALEVPDKGLYKCRILYDDSTRDVEFIPYAPKKI